MQVGLKLNPLYPSDEKSSTFEGKSYGRAMEEPWKRGWTSLLRLFEVGHHSASHSDMMRTRFHL